MGHKPLTPQQKKDARKSMVDAGKGIGEGGVLAKLFKKKPVEKTPIMEAMQSRLKRSMRPDVPKRTVIIKAPRATPETDAMGEPKKRKRNLHGFKFGG